MYMAGTYPIPCTHCIHRRSQFVAQVLVLVSVEGVGQHDARGIDHVHVWWLEGHLWKQHVNMLLKVIA